MTKRKKKICPYFANPHCRLIKNAHVECEANPHEPESCTDFVHRKNWHGEKQ